MNSKGAIRTLIISNNPLSETNNNGKTIASFFSSTKKYNLSQLYFSNEEPVSNITSNFYKISDSDVLKSIYYKDQKAGQVVKLSNKQRDEKNNINFQKVIRYTKNSQLSRILREIVWQIASWNSDELNQWLETVNPELLFFVAGDSLFAYQIAQYIQQKFSAKMIVYITDDYILKRKTINPFWWARRNKLIKKMRTVINDADLLITISPKMQEVYSRIFNKKSFVAANISESMKTREENKTSSYRFVYTGGLHLNRDKILLKIGEAVEEINENFEENIELYIYSNNHPTSSFIRRIEKLESTIFGGSLKPIELKTALNNADSPIFVESFDKKSIEATRLSLSTKIPEYLSLGKPIIAIGPDNISSMNYLSEVAYCINSSNNIKDGITDFMFKKDRSNYGKKANELYNSKHNKEVILSAFNEEVDKIVKGK